MEELEGSGTGGRLRRGVSRKEEGNMRETEREEGDKM